MVKQILKDHVKLWVVKTASVTNPYKKEKWFASVTIGYDYNGEGTSIEKAYNSLTDKIFSSPFIMSQLKDYSSFLEILKANF